MATTAVARTHGRDGCATIAQRASLAHINEDYMRDGVRQSRKNVGALTLPPTFRPTGKAAGVMKVARVLGHEPWSFRVPDEVDGDRHRPATPHRADDWR